MGGAGDDSFFAVLGNDICRGGAGDDTIDGYWDRDRLFGGEGADELTGGAQQDWFVFEDASHSAFGAGDSITDFLTGLDRINLAALGIDNHRVAREGVGKFLPAFLRVGPLEHRILFVE